MQKIIEIEQHLLFFIDFIRVPKYRVRPIDQTKLEYVGACLSEQNWFISIVFVYIFATLEKNHIL